MRADAEHVLTKSVAKTSEYQDTFPLLAPLVRWDVLEDKERLERATVEQAEKVFLEWWEGYASRGTARARTTCSSTSRAYLGFATSSW